MPNKKNNTKKSRGKRQQRNQRRRTAKRGRAPRKSVGQLRDAVAYSNMVARTIALPSDYPPLRIPSINSTQKTAVVALNAATQSEVVSTTAQRWMLIHSPVAPVWTDCAVASDYGRYVTVVEGTRFSGWGTTVNVADVFSSVSSAPGAEFELYSANTSVEDTTATTLPPIGVYNGKQFVYVANNELLCPYVHIDPIGAYPASSPAGNLVVTMEFWTPKGVVDHEFVLLPGALTGLGSGNVGWAASGGPNGSWYRIRDLRLAENASFTATAGAYEMQFQLRIAIISSGQTMINNTVATTDVKFRPWPAARCIEASTPVIYDSCRITAASLRLTNVTALLKQEGSIYAARLNARTTNVFNFTSSTFSGVPVSEKHNLSLQKGLYTYLAPGQDLQFKEHLVALDRNVSPNNAAIVPLLHLDDLQMVNCAIVGDPDLTTSSQLNATFDMHIEFMSSSQLFPTGVTLINPIDYSAAVTALCTTGYFFENPSHYAALARLVLNGLKIAWPMLKQSAAYGVRAGGAHLFTTMGKAMTSKLEQHL